MDLRRLWSCYLQLYTNQPQIEQRIHEMCKTTEELYTELESYNVEKTELEEYYADVVILADGVNSLLAKLVL